MPENSTHINTCIIQLNTLKLLLLHQKTTNTPISPKETKSKNKSPKNKYYQTNHSKF